MKINAHKITHRACSAKVNPNMGGFLSVSFCVCVLGGDAFLKDKSARARITGLQNDRMS